MSARAARHQEGDISQQRTKPIGAPGVPRVVCNDADLTSNARISRRYCAECIGSDRAIEVVSQQRVSSALRLRVQEQPRPHSVRKLAMKERQLRMAIGVT